MKTIKIGIIGYGSIGKVHAMVNQTLPIVLEKNDFSVEIKSIYTEDKNVAPFAAHRRSKSPSEIFQDEDIDLVDICTPNFTHKELALTAISNNKAVYLEKPVAVNLEDAKLIADHAGKAGVINQTGFIYRFMPGLIGIREMIGDGLIGRIINFHVRALHSGYLDAKRPIAWNLRKDTSGGGPILDLGIHLIDAVRFLMGDIKSVAAYGNTEILQRPKSRGSMEMADVDVEDWGIVQMQMVDSGWGTIEVSRVASIFEEATAFEVMGTHGSLHFNTRLPWVIDYYDQTSGIRRHIKYRANSDFGKHVCRCYPQGNRSMGWFIDAQFACLLNCYLNIDARNIIYAETPDFAEGVKAQAIVEACYASLENGSIMMQID